MFAKEKTEMTGTPIFVNQKRLGEHHPILEIPNFQLILFPVLLMKQPKKAQLTNKL